MSRLDSIAAYERQTAPALTGHKVAIVDIERVKGRFAGEWFDANDMKGRKITPDMVIEYPRTICFAYRWYGDDAIHFYAEWQRGGSAKMHRQAWQVYDKAQVVVGHYLQNFDNKHFKSGWLEMGLGEPSPWKTVDTWRIATQFGFEHKGMDALCQRLGIPAKTDHYDPRVARAAVEGDTEAQQRIAAYNIGDVEANTWLYDRFRGWMPNHPHLLGKKDAGIRCNQCGSTDLEHSGIRLASVIAYTLYRCQSCRANVQATYHSRIATTRGVASR